jgi:hypothetical protein
MWAALAGALPAIIENASKAEDAIVRMNCLRFMMCSLLDDNNTHLDCGTERP